MTWRRVLYLAFIGWTVGFAAFLALQACAHKPPPFVPGCTDNPPCHVA